MKKICAYTCITGNYDNLHEVEVVEKNVDYYCFTNNKDLTSKTWKIIYIEDKNLDNHTLSRKIKMLGHPILDENYEISVWMDASVVFDRKVSEFVKQNLKKNAFAAFKHSYRDCIYEEAIECLKKKKDTKDSIGKHIDFLKKEGYPSKYGLYEMTVFIKKHQDEKVKKTMQMWFDMVCHYSKRDQLSFMYCVWKTGLKIDSINESVWNNEWFHCLKHNRKEKLDTCRIYFGKDTDFEIERYALVSYQQREDTYSITLTVPKDTEVIEIQLCDLPCFAYSDLKITGHSIETIKFYDSISYQNKNIFYSDSGILQLEGKFKSGDSFQLSIHMRKLEQEEIYALVEYLSVQNITYKTEISGLNERCEVLLKDNSKIRNSIFWKMTKPMRMLTDFIKKE